VHPVTGTKAGPTDSLVGSASRNCLRIPEEVEIVLHWVARRLLPPGAPAYAGAQEVMNLRRNILCL